MGKARVGVRLKEAIGGGKSLNRSSDLVSLTEKYNVLRKKIHALIGACKNHHAALVQLSQTRLEIANRVTSISKDSPLFESAGQLPEEGQARNEVCSYSSVLHSMAPKTKGYTDKYAQFVVNYAIEWDTVVTKRVSVGLAEAEKLRRDLDHYQKKVESIRVTVNKVLASGKSVDSKQQERLSRNEEKLQTAKESYDKIATNMCILIEEVTDRSWRDLHPMLVKMAQFDSTLSNDETKGLAEMSQVLHKLKTLADKHDLKPQARLKDIETLQPSMLSTRKEPYGLALEADPASLSASGAFGGMSHMGMALPAGSVAPQGSGGFPVPVLSPSGGSALSRDSSFNSSFASAPNSGNLSTSEMMAISANAAPPPTMDQVTEATRNSFTISGSSYPPPLHPSSYNRSSSNLSIDSSLSGGLGPAYPAPAAPPPPPPPATASLSMYTPSAPYPGGAAPYAGAPPPPTSPYGAPGPSHPWSTGAPAPQQSPYASAYAGSAANPFAEF